MLVVRAVGFAPSYAGEIQYAPASSEAGSLRYLSGHVFHKADRHRS